MPKQVSLPLPLAPPLALPLVVFVNGKAGGQQGLNVLEKFRECLPAENVFDLSQGGPTQGYYLLLITSFFLFS